jgi:hypothetical protein
MAVLGAMFQSKQIVFTSIAALHSTQYSFVLCTVTWIFSGVYQPVLREVNLRQQTSLCGLDEPSRYLTPNLDRSRTLTANAIDFLQSDQIVNSVMPAHRTGFGLLPAMNRGVFLLWHTCG